ncbi:MAG: iron-sulfur cluster assembly scaffold protein [Alphaproteobacteria bacterium]|jgi:nitrogen fixation protein NifU and related proteins|nr:iron-sulfur cluster assembly scaffold protein [Candidatus Fonsibacter sp. PEL55]
MNTLLLKHVGALENYGTLKNFTHKCIYKNQTCGDKVTMYLKINNKIIKKISYKTESCLICQASCSIFSDCIKNKSLNNSMTITKEFIKSIFKKKLTLNGKWKKFKFLLNKNYFNRKGCILVPFNALIKLR